MFQVAIAPKNIATGHHESKKNIVGIDQGAERLVKPTKIIRIGNNVANVKNPAGNETDRRRLDKYR